MDAAVATEPIPKKRGRPRKVVSEDAPAVEPQKGVRKASTKATVADKKAEAPKKVAKAPKTATKTTPKTAPKPAAPKAPKATKAAAASKTVPVPKAPAPASASVPAKAASAPKIEDKVVEPPKVDHKPTPVTPSTSKILEEVFKTGTIKPPPKEPEPALQEIVLPTGGAANVVMEQPTYAATKPAMPSEAAQPTPTPTYTPPTPSSAPPTSSPTPPTSSSTPPPPPPRPSISRPTPPTPSSTTPLPRKPTTIPLPARPLNPSKPAAPRPKPISPAELEKAATERHINEGRMPPKYKGAARRVTTIMVGIPVILVVGWDLYKRYDAEIRTKFDVGGRRVDA